MTRVRGLSLTELTLAVGITAFALLTILGVYLSNLKLADQSKDTSAATLVAREFLETLRQTGWESIPSGNRVYDGSVPDAQDGPTGFPPSPYPRVAVANQEFVVTVRLTEIAPLLRSVQVEVGYGETGRVSLETLFRP